MDELRSEGSELSSVGEMHCLVREAADYAAPSGNWKERVSAAARSLGLGWERAKAFYYQDARRVDAGEMDRARRAIGQLREQARQRQIAEHVAFFNRQLAYLKASDPDLYGPHIAFVERGLAAAGVLDCAVAEAAADPATRPYGMRLPSPNDDEGCSD